MASIVDICNRALTTLGANRITAITDANERATACNAAFNFVRDSVLRSHPWNCAVKRAQLAADTSSPEFLYTYKYQLPSDCLKVVEVDTTYDWVVEGRFILTDEAAALKVRYIFREEDPNQYDAILFEVISARLAYEICWDITQSRSMVKETKENYLELLNNAKLNDSQEGSPSTFREDDWITVRY